MNMFKFIFSKWFIINVIVVIVVVIVGFFATSSLLEKMTLHDETITVPNLKTYSLDEVEETLTVLSLKFKVIDSSAYTTKFPKNSVVRQDPKEGGKVKKGRVIYLTINPNGYRSVQIPNLIGKTSRQAVSYLKSVGFRIGKFEYRPDIGKNVVLDVKYKGDILDSLSTLPKQSVIDLVLGAGTSREKTSLPYLIGSSIEEAKSKLREMSLNIGNVQYDEEKNDTVTYFIYSQYPKHNDNIKLKMGSIVDLWLTSDSLKLPKLKVESDSLSTVE